MNIILKLTLNIGTDIKYRKDEIVTFYLYIDGTMYHKRRIDCIDDYSIPC